MWCFKQELGRLGAAAMSAPGPVSPGQYIPLRPTETSAAAT